MRVISRSSMWSGAGGMTGNGSRAFKSEIGRDGIGTFRALVSDDMRGCIVGRGPCAVLATFGAKTPLSIIEEMDFIGIFRFLPGPGRNIAVLLSGNTIF